MQNVEVILRREQIHMRTAWKYCTRLFYFSLQQSKLGASVVREHLRRRVVYNTSETTSSATNNPPLTIKFIRKTYFKNEQHPTKSSGKSSFSKNWRGYFEVSVFALGSTGSGPLYSIGARKQEANRLQFWVKIQWKLATTLRTSKFHFPLINFWHLTLAL